MATRTFATRLQITLFAIYWKFVLIVAFHVQSSSFSELSTFCFRDNRAVVINHNRRISHPPLLHQGELENNDFRLCNDGVSLLVFSESVSRKRALSMTSSNNDDVSRGSLFPSWLLDINTKGGAVVWTMIGFVVPILLYKFLIDVFGMDGVQVGKVIGVGFTFVAILAWVSTYIFRVATKDMTYVGRERILNACFHSCLT
jgi:hypothetical protein